MIGSATKKSRIKISKKDAGSMNDRIGCLWILASLGVIYISVSLFGEGFGSAFIGAIGCFIVLVLALYSK